MQRGDLCDRELRPIAREESHALAPAHPERGERTGDSLNSGRVVGPGKLHRASKRSQCDAVGDARGACLKRARKRLVLREGDI